MPARSVGADHPGQEGPCDHLISSHLIGSLLALGVFAGCTGERGDVATKRAAQTASEGEVFTIYTPDGAAAVPASAEGPPVEERPVNPAYLARQRAYLKAAGEQVPRWRAQGLTEAEVGRRQADLKRSMLGQ
jgi:hypothetical protein